MLVADLPRPGRTRARVPGRPRALALWALISTAWSPGATAPVLEAERGLLYVAAAAAALLLLVVPGSGAALLGGVVAGAVALSLYALCDPVLSRPCRRRLRPVGGYQLAQPLGYWNALGMLAAIGILLAVGSAAHGGHLASVHCRREPVVLLATLYFTFSAADRGTVAARSSRPSSTRGARGSPQPVSSSGRPPWPVSSWRRATTR